MTIIIDVENAKSTKSEKTVQKVQKMQKVKKVSSKWGLAPASASQKRRTLATGEANY